MSRTPHPGTPEPADEEEPWLSIDEVAKLWPVRKDWLPSVAHLADVRVRVTGGTSLGTYGTAPYYYAFHPGDVRRAAAPIAEGRVDMPTVYRTDTPDGRRAELLSRIWTFIIATFFITAALILVLLVVGVIVAIVLEE
jgi:hypothetical protein